MTELFQQLLDWVSLHPLWSGLLVFCVAMAESLAIVGMIVPGVAIMFGIGAMIAADAISFGAAMAWAVAGAIVGDGISFWLGRHYRTRLTGLWPFSRYPESLSRGIAFFEKYGGKSVAIGRFFGPVRAVIPLVAGMMGMPPGRFAIANLLSALAWAPAYLLPGVVFGSSLKLASEVAFRLVIVLLLLVAVAWFMVWFTHRLFNLLQPRVNSLLQTLLSWGNRHPLARSTAAALSDPDHPEARGLSVLATLLLMMAILFAVVTGWSVSSTNATSGINLTLLNGLQSLRTPWGDKLMVAITALADPGSMLLLTTAILAWLILRRDRRTSAYWLAAAGFALIAGPLLKLILQVPRPGIVAGAAGSYAFPSGHTLWASVAFGFLAVLVARGLAVRARWIPYSLAGMIIFSIALSRLYLGMHWLSDVLGSIVLGVAWVAALGIAYSRHVTNVPPSLPLASVIAGSLIAVVVINLLQGFEKKAAFYTPDRPQSEISESVWWQQGWQDLPRVRQDTRSQLKHRLSLQYAGSLNGFVEQLKPAGWHRAEPFDWRSAIKALSPGLPLAQLPLLPQVHAGRHESLSLIRLLSDDRRLVLRLWPADVRLKEQGAPLWIGLVNEQQKRVILDLIAYASSRLDSTEALAQLRRELPDTIAQRMTDKDTLLMRSAQPR